MAPGSSVDEVLAFAARRRCAARWTNLGALGGLAGFLAVCGSVGGRPVPPPLSVGLLAVLALFVLMPAANIVHTFRPMRYAGGPLRARRRLSDAILKSYGFTAVGLIAIWAGLAAGGLGLQLAAAGVGLVAFGVLQLSQPIDWQPVLMISADGFFDRRFTRAPIPWVDVEALVPSKGRAHWPVLRVRDAPGDRTLLRRVYCALGYNCLVVDDGGLECGGGDVLQAIETYAPALTANLEQA